jgi:hypothetical protein
MKARIELGLILGFVLAAFALPASAAYLFPDDSCNLNGLLHIKDGTRADVFDRRLSDNGKGNGGESLDVVVLLDMPATDGGPNMYDIALTCIKTADEDTGGTISLGLWNGGDIIILVQDWGAEPEIDPDL